MPLGLHILRDVIVQQHGEAPRSASGQPGNIDPSRYKGEPSQCNPYVLHFEEVLAKETQQREISFYMRSAMGKLASPLAASRLEGLRDALEALLQISHMGAIESSNNRSVPPPVDNIVHNTLAGAQEEEAAFVPYNAVQIEACATYDIVEINNSSSIGVSTQPVGNSTESSSGTVLPTSTQAPIQRSPTWDMFQGALGIGDYTSAIFHHILVPRQDTRVRMNMGMNVTVKLSAAEALVWTSLPMSSSAAQPNQTSCTSLYQQITCVRYEEQELALRLIQGLALCAYHQRRNLADGCLLHYATEVLQCLVQHVEARYQERRLKELHRQQRRRHGAAVSLSSRRIKSVKSSTMANQEDPEYATFLDLDHPKDDSDPSAPVRLDEGLTRVVLALIHAVEATCHYNPPCLTRLVQAGGVKALLDVAYLPSVPVSLRATVLDAMSVLLQEVTPFRRATAGGGGVELGDNTSSKPDPHNDAELLPWMVQQAMSSTGRGGPFFMDRASASKFDSAVRDWFSRSGLSHLVPAVLDLRRDEATLMTSKATLMKTLQRSNQQRERKLTSLLKAIDGHRVSAQ